MTVPLRTVCAMMLLVIAPAFAQDATPTGGDALQRYYTANGLLNRGLHELALVEYQAFLETSGDHAKAPVARYGMGLCLMELDRPDEAVVVLAPVVTKRDGPYVTESRLLMAQAHVARGDLPAAVAPLEAAVRETDDDHPLLPEAWGLLIDVQSRRGAHREVIAGAETVRSRWPDHAVAEHVTLRQGLAAMALGEHEAAALAFKDVRERFPDGAMRPRATLALAQALHRTERPERAAPFYREVLDGKDRALHPDAQYGYALLLHRGEDAQAALAQLAKFLEQSPDHERTADVERLAGRILYENGRHDQAIALFSQAAEREPGRAAESALWIAKCHLAMDAPDDAVVVLRESLGAHPDDAVAGDMRYELALGLVRADAPAEAIAPLRTLLEREPNHRLAPDAIYLMAVALHRLGDYEGSLGAAQAFEVAAPDHERAVDVALLAIECAALTEEHGEVVQRAVVFLDANGDHEQAELVQFRLGMAHYHQGRYDDAGPILTGTIDGADTAVAFSPALVALGEIAFAREQWPAAATAFADALAVDANLDAADTVRLKLGIARLRGDDAGGAIDALEELIALQPAPEILARANFERGQALLALTQPEDAAEAFRAALTLGPEPAIAALAHRQLAGVALADDRYEEAAGEFQAAAASSDGADAAESLYQAGLSLLTAQRYEEAADTFARLIDAHPDADRRDDAIAQRAVATARNGLHEEALAQLAAIDEATRSGIEPALAARLLYEEAWSLRALDRPEEARRVYERLLAGSGDLRLAQHARLELAEVLTTHGELEAADALLAELLPELSAEDAALRETAMYQHAHLATQRGAFADAAQRWTEFLDAYPHTEHEIAAHLMAGEAWFQTGKHDEAVPHFAYVAQRDETEAVGGTALLRLGESLAQLQSWDQSEEAFDRFLAAFAGSPHWYQAEFGRGWARENRGRLAEARSAYQRVVDRHTGPTAARAQFQIGECLFAEDRFDEAAVALLKVDILFDHPEWSAAALFEAARCFRALGDEDRALEHFQAVVDQHPDTRWSEMAARELDGSGASPPTDASSRRDSR